MKKLLLLLFVTALFSVNAQEYVIIKDYSFEDSYGYESSFLTTSLKKEKNGKVEKNEVIIKKGKKIFPQFSIPFSELENFKQFLSDGLSKFKKWDSLRVENNIVEMKKQISVFDKEVSFVGDDYGVFIMDTNVELNFISWKSGKSVMQLRIYANNGVRSDGFGEYLHYDNKELKKTANNNAFQSFLNDLSEEKFIKEKEKINSKASLFD
ncbi:hypothetical protein N9K85_06355 [Flavobacteriaceae bacterium]|nr:hypothetical protein [Flavobacteriaceae bacterium]